MANKTKPRATKTSKVLRVPVNPGQAKLIEAAHGNEQFSVWARSVLLNEAGRLIELRRQVKASQMRHKP